jgi:hypothetical protein
MRLLSRANHQSLCALIVFQLATPMMAAMAETPDSPADSVRRATTFEPPSGAEPHVQATHNLRVRPVLSEERRDASGRELPATSNAGNGILNRDSHPVRTIPIRPDPGATTNPDHFVVQTIRVPSQPAPQ